MEINLDYYRVFYQVARCGSVTRAARALFSNQPNVTRTIHLLEQALGCSLFLRSSRGMTLTPEGALLLSHVTPALEHLEAAQRELTALQKMETGAVSIGASEVSLRCLLLPILGQFRSRFPGIQVRVSNHSTPQAIQALQEGLVDFAVVTTPLTLPTGLEQIPLKDIQEIPICGKALSATFSGCTVVPKAFLGVPLVCLGRDTATYRFYENWFTTQNLPFHPEIEAATADQILPMVRQDLGIGFIPEDFLDTAPESSGLYPIDLNPPVPKRTICLIRHAGMQLSLAARKFLSLLDESALISLA